MRTLNARRMLGNCCRGPSMSNHPNRNKSVPSTASTPTPSEVRAARERAGLTQTEAATLIHTSLRGWQQWEAPVDTPDHRRMHPAFFELFLLKSKQLEQR
jgi:putative transcriptional regulator